MGRIYYKELPLFHIYDSSLTGMICSLYERQ